MFYQCQCQSKTIQVVIVVYDDAAAERAAGEAGAGLSRDAIARVNVVAKTSGVVPKGLPGQLDDGRVDCVGFFFGHWVMK